MSRMSLRVLRQALKTVSFHTNTGTKETQHNFLGLVIELFQVSHGLLMFFRAHSVLFTVTRVGRPSESVSNMRARVKVPFLLLSPLPVVQTLTCYPSMDRLPFRGWSFLPFPRLCWAFLCSLNCRAVVSTPQNKQRRSLDVTYLGTGGMVPPPLLNYSSAFVGVLSSAGPLQTAY